MSIVKMDNNLLETSPVLTAFSVTLILHTGTISSKSKQLEECHCLSQHLSTCGYLYLANEQRLFTFYFDFYMKLKGYS